MANYELAGLLMELIQREPKTMMDILSKSFEMNQQEIDRMSRVLHGANRALQDYRKNVRYELALDQVSK